MEPNKFPMSEIDKAVETETLREGKDTPDTAPSKFTNLKNKIKECFEWIRVIVLSLFAAALVLGLCYNFFAPSEKDLPPQFFTKLYKVIDQELDGHMLQLVQEGEWRTLNETKH